MRRLQHYLDKAIALDDGHLTQTGMLSPLYPLLNGPLSCRSIDAVTIRASMRPCSCRSGYRFKTAANLRLTISISACTYSTSKYICRQPGRKGEIDQTIENRGSTSLQHQQRWLLSPESVLCGRVSGTLGSASTARPAAGNRLCLFRGTPACRISCRFIGIGYPATDCRN